MEGPKGALVRKHWLGSAIMYIFDPLPNAKARLTTLPCVEPALYFAVLTSPFLFSDVAAHCLARCSLFDHHHCCCS